MTHSDMHTPDHGGDVWDTISPSTISSPTVVDFSANVNPLGTSPLAAEAVRRGIRLLNFYPDTNCSRLKDAIASYVHGVSSENILVGNGSTEIIHLFSQVFLEVGEEAIIPQPTFSEYEYAVVCNRARAISWPMRNDFRVEAEPLLASITPKTRAIFLCNPNNPTSTTLDRSTVQEIVDGAAKHKVMVFLDECFIEFAGDTERFSLSHYAKRSRNLLVLRSLTKVFGLPGLRVGYALGNKNIVTLLDKFKVTWSVNTLAQIAGVAALKDTRYLDATKRLVRRERTYLTESIPRFGVSITPPKANFLLVGLRGQMRAPELKRRLLKRGILIRDCSGFRGLGSGFVRFAVRKRGENVALLRALGEILQS